MSVEDLAALPTERLLEMFAAVARRFGLGTRQLARLENLRDPLAPALAPTDFDPLKPAAEQLWALSLVLIERLSVAEAERLLEDEDPDIRMTAAGFLGGLSPELANAAIKGAQTMRPTREILALQRRAREAPPQRPTLEEMSDDELVARFEDAALRESGAYLLDYLENLADQELRNAICREIWNVMRQLKARGLLTRLLAFFGSGNLTLRREAATACLRIAEPEALAALESVTRNGVYGDGIAARITLQDWREKGRVVYGM